MFEYFTITDIILFKVLTEPPLKRQRLLRHPSIGGIRNGASTDGSSALAFIECLEKCKGGNDSLQLLVRISDTLARMSQDDVPAAVTKLVDRFSIESEAAVRAKILWVLAELGEVTEDTTEKSRIVDETAKLLRTEESHRVKSQGLATLLKLGDHHRYDNNRSFSCSISIVYNIESHEPDS